MKLGNQDRLADENWSRYIYCRDRGHTEYMEHARLCERMYLGGGSQWSEEDKAVLKAQKRPAYEFNEIMPAVNSAVGYQIHNRMDIAFKPRGEGDSRVAAALSKIVMQVASMSRLHWVETQVFSDGLIQQRGYYDARISFEKNVKGEVELSYLDPLDVLPDPNGKSYDPDTWGDVTITRWLTCDEIESTYGKEARSIAEASNDDDQDFGDMDSDDVERSKFGQRNQIGLHDAYSGASDGIKRYRVIERQVAEWSLQDCLVAPTTGDVMTMAYLSEAQIQRMAEDGVQKVKRRRRQIRWIVTTYSQVLHDDISPYEHFTIIPYFAFFRRGLTRGLVDNAIGPQEALNKSVSQYVHIVNTSANSGWMVQQNSLTNISTDELSQIGAMTGLVLEYKEGAQPPTKIQPNQIPQGVDRLIDRATSALKSVTVPDAMRGQTEVTNESGVLFQAKQFAAQQQLAVPLDNLAYTRNLLAQRILKLIQRYYDSYRVFRISEMDPTTGKEKEEMIEINKYDPATDSYLNDVTIGNYDAVITEVPMQVTFENTQFKQALDMRQQGIAIPDATIVRYSNLADKESIVEAMQSATTPDPEADAKAELIKAQTRKADAEATSKSVETQFSAIQTAQVIATTPQTASLADALLKSAGYVDRDMAPIVPQLSAQAAMGMAPLDMPTNSNPLTPLNPTNPAVGMNAGIETAAPDSTTPEGAMP